MPTTARLAVAGPDYVQTFTVAKPKIAYSLDEAAQATGYSVWTIRRAVKSNELVVHYPRADEGKSVDKPCVLVTDLVAWVEDGPTEAPEK